jgi:hypothetical protein
MQILVGDFHWLIRAAHLLVGAAAVILNKRIGEQYVQINPDKPTEQPVHQSNHERNARS